MLARQTPKKRVPKPLKFDIRARNPTAAINHDGLETA
jgi:hypothetical protein